MSYNSKYKGSEVEGLLDQIPKLEELIGSHNKEIQMFCIEPVTVTVGGVDTLCAAGEYSTVFVGDEEFTITPTSNQSIKILAGYPIPLTWYDWLEGVDVFENIIFDMNEIETYGKWIQYNQGNYHVQKAQYANCIFWSDKPYTHSPFEQRTNYTIYHSAELPMCYSTIPENTYKPFYCAYGVISDPNWNNPNYVNSYANVSGATQTFSYYGASAIGIFNMAVDIITLPKDCRGLMFWSPAIQHAGIFDAKNTTNFGAKKGSWQEAFGNCTSLTTLYIQNLKTSINVSWSPISNDSLTYIIENAINTSAITISLSPYTWYRLTDAIKEAATAKNITLALITTNYSDDSRWTTKQDKITDLDTIRSGAAKGATALQSYTEKYTGTITGITMNGASKGTSGVVDLGTVITAHQDISGKADKSSLSAVATSGSYNDLSNKPTIPSAVTESTVSGWGFTKNTGTYSKPSTGIPKTDLATAVQTSLEKADTALQSYTEQYKGTITGVSANGTSVATSGVANIPAASTSKYGVTKLSSATNSSSTSLAATASAVKAAYDLANSYKGTVTGVKVNGSTKSPSSGTVDLGNVVTSIKINGTTKNPSSGVVDLGTIITAHQDISGKQDKLVSGTNIKTVNGQSLLGSGNIVIEGGSGGGSSSGGSGAYAQVNHGTSDTTFELTPNTFHVWDEVASLVLTLSSEQSGVANEYVFQFTSGTTATSLTLPDGIKWANDSVPSITEDKIYQISILNGLAVALEFNAISSTALIENHATIAVSGRKFVISFEYPVESDLSINTSLGSAVISKGQSTTNGNIDMPDDAYILNITPNSDAKYIYTW